MESLWPDSIEVADHEVAPISILKEQAALLGQKTQNLVIAEVDSLVIDERELVANIFYLVAPALNNYRYQLFTALHEFEEFYPLEINVTFDEQKLTVTSEEELLNTLANIFSHPKTIRIIQSMLLQSGWEPAGAKPVTPLG